MKPPFSIVVVVYNGLPFLEPLVKSLAAQTLHPAELIVVDNLSADGSRELLPSLLSSLPFPTRLLFENCNRGYCAAANRGLREAPGEFVLLLNQDTRLDKNFCRAALEGFADHPRIGMVSGRILRFDGTTVDSLGQYLSRSLYPKERGYNVPWGSLKEDGREIFSVCGAVAFYRREMLQEIAFQGEYLDEDFFMFFDDIDLGWRAQRRGWKARYAPEAIAFHSRSGTLSPGRKVGLFFRRPLELRYHLVKNRYLTLLKNASWREVIKDLPFLLLRDLPLLFTLLSHPSQGWRLWKERSLFKRALLKRRHHG